MLLLIAANVILRLISSSKKIDVHKLGNKNCHILPTGQWYAPSAIHSVILCYILLYSALHRFTLLYSAQGSLKVPKIDFFIKAHI